MRRQSHKTHSSPSLEGQALRAPGGGYGAMWACGQLSATWHWSGAPQWTPEATSAQSPSGPVCAAPCPVSPWRALSIDGPGRPWVTQGWAHCRLLFVQLSGIGVSWEQSGGGVTGQSWTVQVVVPRLSGSGRTLSRKQSRNSRSLWGPESLL